MLAVEERPWLQYQHYSSWSPQLRSIPSYQMSAIIHQIVSQLLNVHRPPHQSKTQNEQISKRLLSPVELCVIHALALSSTATSEPLSVRSQFFQS